MTGGGPVTVRSPEGRDRGASSIELALLTPILILVIMLVVQFTMVFHARHVALASAQSAARVARSQPEGAGWRAAAEARARDDVRKIGPQLITDLNVEVGGNVNERWVVVSGHAPKVVPFMTFQVSQRSRGPIECFRPDRGDGATCE